MTDHIADGSKKVAPRVHGPGAWDANPWVWVYTFRRIES
jgi:hypothetical protein